MRTIKIGRQQLVNDIVINNDKVSRQHAEINVDGAVVTIKDLGSTGGTYVNNLKITTKTLLHGDIVMLADYKLDWETIVKNNLSNSSSGQGRTTIIPSNNNNNPFPDIVDRRTIGRINSQILLPYNDVSSNHATLCKRANGNVVIIDNNSTNGTFVNGVKVISHQTLKKGDVVMIANKYKVDWANIFPVKSGFKMSWLGYAAIAIGVVVAMAFALIKIMPMKSEKIYAMYKNSVVFIHSEGAYRVTYKDKNNIERDLGDFFDDKTLTYWIVDGRDAYNGIQVSSGTGFFVSDDGKIITNKHVVHSLTEDEDIKKINSAVQSNLETLIEASVELYIDNGDEKYYDLAVQCKNISENFKVKYENIALYVGYNDTYITSTNDLTPCTVYKVSNDENVDLAVLQLNTKKTPAGSKVVDINQTAQNDLKIGSHIYTIGFPKGRDIGETSVGMEANNQSGEITQQRGEYVYGHNISILQGASGSPVFNNKGKFAGVIVSGFLGVSGVSLGYNHAILPKHVTKLME